MTLCIAAVAREEKKIVTITDFMLSTPTDSIESPATKILPLGNKNRWLVMFAGDPSSFLEISTETRNRLADTNEHVKDVISAFKAAYKEKLRQKIEDEILSPYGMTHEQFFREGRHSFGDEEFLRILRDVQNTQVGTDFLVAGFEGDNSPCLLSFSDPGTSYLHDMMSFHAIGCGASLANASLMANFNPFASLTDVIYRVSEAKFNGEKAPGVGGKTFLTVFGLNGD